MSDKPKSTFADFGITIAKLDQAIIAAYGEKRSNEMTAIIASQKEHGAFNRPYEHNAALRHIAVYGGPADALYVLRAAATVVDEHGFYCEKLEPVTEVDDLTEAKAPYPHR